MGDFSFFLMPYVFTVFIAGRKMCPIAKEMGIEESVAIITSAQIPWEYSKEAIKAQTIIVRTNLYRKNDREEMKEQVQSAAKILKEKRKEPDYIEKFSVFLNAAKGTVGKVLKSDEMWRELPYHRLSSGKTRDGKEVLGEEYSYIPSVDASFDIKNKNYVKGIYFSEEKLKKILIKKYPGFSGDCKEIQIEKADSCGYVLEIKIGNQTFPGEEVAAVLGLPSSCFTVQVLDENIRFLCRGIGHGIGMSQYCAHIMAENGYTYQEILLLFFPEMQLKNV